MKPNFFRVIGTDNTVFDFNTINLTLHFDKERGGRHEKIVTIIGSGEQLFSFVVDRHHPNGNEIHTIFSNGVIVVRNQRTNLLITELIARPKQISRYWEKRNMALPNNINSLLSKALEHQRKNYNNW